MFGFESIYDVATLRVRSCVTEYELLGSILFATVAKVLWQLWYRGSESNRHDVSITKF